MDNKIGNFLHNLGYSANDISIRFSRGRGWSLESKTIPAGILSLLEQQIPKEE